MGIFRGVELDGLELSGPRLTLRPWQPADASAVEQALQAPQMHAWFALPHPYTFEHARDFVTRTGQAERAEGTGLACAAVETGTGRLVGSAELRLPRPGRPWPDIGYWIVADAHGKGYAAEATRVLTEWAFAQDVPRVQLQMDVSNVASAATALAAGFRFDDIRRGVLGLPDARHDLATFGRLSTDSGDPIPHRLPRLPEGGLRDDAIMLRALEPGDAPALIEQENDALTVATGFTGVAPSVVEIERLAARAQLEWLVGPAATFAIIDAGTRAFAGSVRVRLAGPPQVGGLGYALHPRFRGRGYTGRALRLIVDWAFRRANFARLELGVKTNNLASQKAALAGGFDPDAILTARLRNPDGTFSDEVRFVLVNPKYR